MTRPLAYGLLIVILSLAACRPATGGEPATTAESTTAVATATTRPTATATQRPATATPAPTTTVAPSPTAGEEPTFILEVRTRLSQAFNMSEDAINIISWEPAVWRDGCLGLGSAGEMCTQALVDGYRITAEIEGQRYEVRSNSSGTQVRWQLLP